jgi:hypothetical protein
MGWSPRPPAAQLARRGQGLQRTPLGTALRPAPSSGGPSSSSSADPPRSLHNHTRAQTAPPPPPSPPWSLKPMR